jgi:hypothetical protein
MKISNRGVLFLCCLTAWQITSVSYSAIPETMSYQGYLENALTGSPYNGNVSVKFSLYTAAAGGTAIWTETRTVDVSKGIFSVILGKTQPLSSLDFGTTYYLGIKVGTDPEMTPRTELSSVGYAFRSKTSEQSLSVAPNTIVNSMMANNTVTTQKIADGTIASADLADDAVTVAKISGAGATAGKVLKFNGSDVVWDVDQTGGMTLPYSGTATTAAGALLGITQQGTGNNCWAINGLSSGPIGVRGETTNSLGAGLAGYGKITGGIGVFGQGYAWGGYFMGSLYTNSRIGVGTESPERAIHVRGGNPRILVEGTDGSSSELNLRGSTGTDWAMYRHGSEGDLRFYQAGDKITFKNGNGNVGIGTSNPTAKLTVRGNVLIQSASTGAALLELGEGLDYAEGFDVSDGAEVKPGCVVVIDPDNPGSLKLCDMAYDSKVAGIVAGANGLKSAVRLGVGQFDHDVALAGRVYCNVDGRFGAVSPGDLLTTSPTTGYAMVVSDPSKAQGAVLGKAMESLPVGEQRQILVLVTLQ